MTGRLRCQSRGDGFFKVKLFQQHCPHLDASLDGAAQRFNLSLGEILRQRFLQQLY